MIGGRVDDEARTTIDDHGREFIAHTHRFPANAVGFLIAPASWMLYFVTVYSVQGAGCAAGVDRIAIGPLNALDAALIALTVVFMAALVASGAWSFVAWRRLLEKMEEEEARAHRRAAFLSYGALLHAGLFLIAMLWSAVPILLVETCDMLGSA